MYSGIPVLWPLYRVHPSTSACKRKKLDREGSVNCFRDIFFCVCRPGAFLRAAYEGKMDVVLKLIEEEGVPVSVKNQVCGEVNIASYS